MRAVGFTGFGGPEVMRVLELPEPHAGPGQVRIRVIAADINPSDSGARSGAMTSTEYGRKFFPHAEAYVVGWDAAGFIDEIGDGADGFAIGDTVVALLHPHKTLGAQAEYVVAPVESVVHVPADADLIAWSTLPMNALTAWMALVDLDLPRGASVAVTGAAGAVGGYVVQLAKARGHVVIADASEPDRGLVESLGADYIVRRGDDFADQVRATFPEGVDGVVDTALLNDAVTHAARDGATVASLRGHQGAPERGVHWAYPMVNTQLRNAAALAELRDLAAAGILTLRVGQTFTPEQAISAHQAMEKGGLRGRPVIVFDPTYLGHLT